MSLTAYLYPGLFSIFQLMAWIACCVSFGGVLVTFNFSGGSWSGYHRYVSGNGEQKSWDEFVHENESSLDCDGAAKGFVAMLSFAFITTLVTLVLHILRITRYNLNFPSISASPFVATVEFALTAVSVFFFFLAVCVFGGACYTGLGNLQYVSSVAATGYAYVIVCFFLLIFALPLSYLMLKQIKDTDSQHYVAQTDAQSDPAGETSAPTGTYGGFQNDQKYDTPQTTTENPNV